MPAGGPNGSLRPYTQAEIDAFELETLGVRDGSHLVEEFAFDACTGVQKFMCRWDKRYDAVQYLVGDMPITYTDSGVTKISRIMPQTHPGNELFSNWIASKCMGVQGHKFLVDEDGLATFDRAILTVLYEPAPFFLSADADTSLESDRYVIKEGYSTSPVQVKSQYMTMPGGIMTYYRNGGGGPPNNVKIPYNVGFVQNEEVFSWVWCRLPQEVWQSGSALRERIFGDPSAGTKSSIGAINLSFDPIGRPPGTTQLMGVTPLRRLDPTGLGYCLDLRLDFSFSPQGKLNFYYFDTSVSTRNGYYYVGVTGDSYHAIAAVPDDKSLFWVREFADFFTLD